MKKYKIVFLPDAADDRDEIKGYLAQFGEGSVERFFTLLRKATTNLKSFPYSCPVYEGDTDYRKLIVGDYLAFYIVREETGTIEIHRILHGSRDVKRHLK